MTDTLTPSTLEAVQSAVLDALEKGEPMEVVGAGTRRAYGRAVQAPRSLSTRALAGVVDYQPHELILVARPGTPLAEIRSLLEEHRQLLAFEPPLGGEGATLGGVLACNLSGPRRFKAGAARDHLLGFQAVTGRGEIVRGGGRVVKNVTGYDLPKLMCGSFGTLAVMTEVVVKVLPRAETERTLLVPGLEDGEALTRLTELSRSRHEPTGLAHWPAEAAGDGALRDAGGGKAVTLVRLEGPAPSLETRCTTLRSQLPGNPELLDEASSRACWSEVREVAPLGGIVSADAEHRLWRLSVPPGSGATVGEGLRGLGITQLGYDWGGGLVWALGGKGADPAKVHALARKHGGHAQVLRDLAGDRVETPFSTLPPGQHRLTVNLKAAFDPHGILNPGRMYPDL